jgi:CTP:molybdopterin cytidylyltransferase MocA
MPSVTILLLAAGGSTRMAPRDKLMEPVDGVPLLRDRALAAHATGAPVIVALRPDRPERRAVVEDLPLHLLTVPDAEGGMARSIAAGAAAVGPDTALMIAPADTPDITTRDMALLIEAAESEPEAIHQGASHGRFGHPIVFPPDLVPGLTTLDGDRGARSLILANEHRRRLHDLPGEAAIEDLDTPEDWARWRARTGR